MNRRSFLSLAMLLAAGTASPVLALSLPEPAPRYHWECVPFARAISGVEIYGDAWTWWDQADGRYKRGSRPKPGAVLAFEPHNAMQLGHVAVVSSILDARTITVTHANWSMIDGRRGQVERDVMVRDVSESGDWSAVRVWYAPIADLGTTAWPVHGFIYPGPGAGKAPADGPHLATAKEAKPTGKLAYLGKLLPKLR